MSHRIEHFGTSQPCRTVAVPFHCLMNNLGRRFVIPQEPPERSTPFELLQDSSNYMVVTASAKCLRRLKREDVFRVPPGTCCSPQARLYKNMMPDIPLALSRPCGRFFHEEDFEFAFLKENRCPFSRVGDVGDYGSC